jgi:hypothetical protein
LGLYVYGDSSNIGLGFHHDFSHGDLYGYLWCFHADLLFKGAIIKRRIAMKEIRIKIIDDQIALAKTYAEYWIAMATTGECKKSRQAHGFNGPELTDEEKVTVAMDTANRHISRMRELIDVKAELLSGDQM